MAQKSMKVVKGLTLALAVVALGASQAEAGWWHRNHGSSGGSSGGGWGGGWFRHHHRAAYGSWGGSSGGSSGGYGYSYGSSGGSSGGYGCSVYGSSGGSSGGYISYGSSGGSSGGYGYGSSGGSSGGYIYGGTVVDKAPVIEGGSPADNPPPEPRESTDPMMDGGLPPEPAEGADPGAGAMRRIDSRSALLMVSVPAGAKVTVNGRLTSSTGSRRQFISRGLEQGQRYGYDVTAEIEKNGEKLVKTRTVQLAAGQTAAVTFDFDQKETVAAKPVETSLTLHVPADAKLYLAGQEMKATGPVRQFSTTRLPAGGEWLDYSVRVVANVNGREVTKEQVISLAAGEAREVAIDFVSDDVTRTAAK